MASNSVGATKNLADMCKAPINYLRSQSLAKRSTFAACFLVFFFPKALLGVLGFGALGPMAGFLAASIQPAASTPWLFSLFQGAAMGGTSATKVFGVIKGSAVLTAMVTHFAGKKSARK